MKKGLVIAIVGVLLAVVLVLVFWGDKIFKRSEAAGATSGADGAAAPVVFPLKKGSSGPEVAKLQTWLNKKAAYYMILTPLNVDGIFGPKTEGMCLTITNSKEVSEDFYNKNIK